MNLAYRRDIDGLRAIAVLPVVLGHAGLPLFSGGFIGVDVFFVISGFLITGILLREIEAGQFSLLNFYERRARRILPALFVVMAVCLVVAWFTWPPLRFRGLGTASIATLAFASNILFWLKASDYFAEDVLLEPLLHTWSLAVEEQFYLVFPLLLWACARMAQRRLILLAAAVTAMSFAYAVWATLYWPVAAFYLIPSRIWELGIGVLLALGAFPVIRQRALAEALAALGLLAIVLSVLLLHEGAPFPGLAAAPPVLGAMAILWAGQDHQTAVGRLLSTTPFVGIGLISYSLYLVHWPVLIWARDISGGLALSAPVAWFCVGLSLGLAWLSWRFVERPFRLRKGAAVLSQGQIFKACGAGGSVLGAAAVAVILTDGMPQRVPAEAQRIYAQAIERDPRYVSCEGASGGEPSCVVGADAARADMVLWGDSHVWALTPGMDDWARAQGLGVAVYQRSACAPVTSVYRADKSDGLGCAQQNDAILAALQADPVSYVILHARWPIWADGTRGPYETGPPLGLVAMEGRGAPKGAETIALFTYGLDQTLSALRPYTDEIVILGGVPEMETHIPNMFAERSLQPWAIPAPPTLADYEARHANANAILRRLADKHGATFIDLGPIFCTPACAFKAEAGPLLYRDDDHLSIHGARLMVPRLMGAALEGISASAASSPLTEER